MRQIKVFFTFLLFILPFVSFAKNGIYIILDAGGAKQTGLPSAIDIGAQSRNTQIFPKAIHASIGYNHDLFSWLGIGLDLGLGRYGDTTYSYANNNNNTNFHSTTLEFLALTQLHWRQWDWMMRLGGVRQTNVISGEDTQPDQTQIHPELSLGFAYNFTPHFATIFSIARVFGDQIQNFAHFHNRTPRVEEGLAGIRITFS